MDIWDTGRVTAYDAKWGFATVALETLRTTTKLFCGAFFSGLPVRYPMVGDMVRIQVRPQNNGTYHPLVARLQR